MTPDPDSLVDVATAATRFEAEILARVIEEAGIPVQVYGDAAERVGFRFDGWSPVRVVVRQRDVGAARAALDRNREDSVDLDWSEVDTGDTPDNEAANGALAGTREVRRFGGKLTVVTILAWMIAGIVLAIVAIVLTMVGP